MVTSAAETSRRAQSARIASTSAAVGGAKVVVEFGLQGNRVGSGLHRIADLIASRQQPK